MLINRTTITAHGGLKIQRLSANFEGYSYRVELILPEYCSQEYIEDALWDDLGRELAGNLRKQYDRLQKKET